MSPLFSTSSSHTDEIVCPGCGRAGAILWEETQRFEGSEKQFVGIEGGFFERLSSRAPYPIEVVCGGCGAIHSEVTVSPQTKTRP